MMRQRHARTRRLGVAALAVLLLVAGAHPSPARAGSHHFVASLSAAGDGVILAIAEVAKPVGSLTGAIDIDRESGPLDCELLIGLGACNPTGGAVRFSVVVAPAMEGATEVLRITTSGASANLILTSIEGTDEVGTPLRAEIAGSMASVAGQAEQPPSPGPGEQERALEVSGRGFWVISGVVALILAGAVAHRLRALRRRTRIDGDPGV